MKTSAFAIFLIFACAIFCSAKNDDISSIYALGKKAETQKDFSTAIIYYSRLINKCREHASADTLLCKGLFAGGNCCANTNRYIEALQFYTFAIEQAEKCNMESTKMSCLNNIGNVYALFNDYEKAAYYYEQAYNIAQKKEDEGMLSILSINLVKIYAQLDDTEKAKELLHSQIAYPQKNRFMNQYYILRNQGIIAKADRNFSLATEFFQQARETILRHGLEKDNLADIYIEMGEMKMEQGRKEEAVEYFKSAINAAKDGRYLFQEGSAYKKLANAYKAANKNDSAEHYLSLYAQLSDSVFNQRMFNNTQNKLFKYENKINNEHIGLLESTITYLIIIILCIVSAVCLILYHNRRLHTAQKLLIKKNEELIKQAQENRRLRNERQNEPQRNTEDLEEEDRNENAALLDQDKIKILIADILKVMDDTETFSDPDFNLTALAKLVGSNTKYVSAAIKDTYKKNFKTFLNEYRIREASIRLTDKERYSMFTISAIGESVGFTSTNGFIIAFKKIVGVTPSVYRKLSEGEVS